MSSWCFRIRTENSEEVIFEETTDENFPRLVNDINRRLKTHRVFSRINKKS